MEKINKKFVIILSVLISMSIFLIIYTGYFADDFSDDKNQDKIFYTIMITIVIGVVMWGFIFSLSIVMLKKIKLLHRKPTIVKENIDDQHTELKENSHCKCFVKQ